MVNLIARDSYKIEMDLKLRQSAWCMVILMLVRRTRIASGTQWVTISQPGAPSEQLAAASEWYVETKRARHCYACPTDAPGGVGYATGDDALVRIAAELRLKEMRTSSGTARWQRPMLRLIPHGHA